MTDKPVFDPAKDCPFDIENEHPYRLYGILLALVEQQQRVALHNWENTVAKRYKKGAFHTPRTHIPPVISAAQAHEDRLAKFGWKQHSLLIDRVIDALPDPLDMFIPAIDRFRPEKAYRKMSRHLHDAYREYRMARDGVDVNELPEDDEDQNAA